MKSQINTIPNHLCLSLIQSALQDIDSGKFYFETNEIIRRNIRRLILVAEKPQALVDEIFRNLNPHSLESEWLGKLNNNKILLMYISNEVKRIPHALDYTTETFRNAIEHAEKHNDVYNKPLKYTVKSRLNSFFEHLGFYTLSVANHINKIFNETIATEKTPSLYHPKKHFGFFAHHHSAPQKDILQNAEPVPVGPRKMTVSR